MKKVIWCIISLAYVLSTSIMFHATAMEMMPVMHSLMVEQEYGTHWVADNGHCQEEKSSHDTSSCIWFVEASNQYSAINIKVSSMQFYSAPRIESTIANYCNILGPSLFSSNEYNPPQLIEPYEKGIVILNC